MKILIASTIVPFIEGGSTFIVDWLAETMEKYGHQVETIKIPFYSYYPEMLEQMLALRLIDLSESGDMLIAIRTPSYIMNHPNKVVWFIHHHRGAYDLWGTSYQDIPSTAQGLQIRESIIQADNIYLREARKIFTNSKVVSQRLMKFNGLESKVLYPPLLNPERFYCNDYRDYIFYPSRITGHKRQSLAIESMKYTKTKVRLVIAGKPDSKEQLENIESVVGKNNLHKNVTIIGRWISEDEKIELFANSLGCIYIPYDEDSYGYPSLEASHSKKAIISCTDSGGTNELIEDGVNGFIVSPDPRAIAEAMDKMYYDRAMTKKMGQAAYDRLISMDITWDSVVERLLE